MISRKMKTLDYHKISYVLVSNDTLFVGMIVPHVSLQILDFQYFECTYQNQIPIWSLDL
jgi:hypothetical protein